MRNLYLPFVVCSIFFDAKINEHGYKVTFSGTSQMNFTGYYDHFLLHLFTISKVRV